MNKFVWPLNNASFTLLDRIKLCLFFLNKDNFWTQSKYVKKIEEEFAKFVGSKYAVFVSSGSTANTLLAMHLKDNYYILLQSYYQTTFQNLFVKNHYIQMALL